MKQILCLLCFSITSFAFGIEIENVENAFFKSNNINESKISLYKKLSKTNTSSVIVKESQVLKYKFNAKTERVLDFRARFLINKPIDKINLDLFQKAKTYTNLNRKTQFTKINDLKFAALRPSFWSDTTFEMNAVIFKDKNDDAFKDFKLNSGLTQELKFGVTQDLSNYSKGLFASSFYLGFYKLDETRTIIEVIGNSALKKDLPDFVQNKMHDGYDEKIKDFRKKLIKLLK